MEDEGFLGRIADALAGLPGVVAVSLGGSRAVGNYRVDSDWDLAVYYRGGFRPEDLGALGWEGYVSGLGEWGGGVFNGGAWLTVEGRAVDVHYRDLAVIEEQMREAEQGRFRVEPLAFHLAGIPSYLVLAELGANRVLRGELPRPEYPEALRRNAPGVWRQHAELTLDYAASGHAAHGRLGQCVGLIVVAASCYAHAVLAARGKWVTNEKTLLTRAGLAEVDAIVEGATREPGSLRAAVGRVRELCRATLEKASTGA
ncbi:nucleotidyltransferase domain-containing protein [Nocardia terpenica]|uniref:nucleotidyltransferase domain-containing protein n=1 Tax=Nocardia terpenica TaxID=455432 RepID=UPI002FE13F59